MKVVRHDAEELYLVDRVIPLRVIGAGFALFAIVFMQSSDPAPFPASLFPWLFVLLGSALAILPRNTMIRFDRAAGEVTIDKVGTVLPRSTRTIPLAQIHTVDVEESPGSKGGSTYRVRLLITEDLPVNFTEYSSSGREAKDALAETVRVWLGGNSA